MFLLNTKKIISYFCAGMIALSIFSLRATRAEENRAAPEIIICPNFSAADAGAPPDEYYFAKAYDKGYCGIPVSKTDAKKWYEKAASHGHMLAQHELGEIYFTGENAAPDYPKARQWYLAAAKQGYGPSQLRLGFLFAEAHFKGLSTDYAEAEKWFLKAAKQNSGDAQFRIGNFYHNYKKPPDIKKAILWLTRAAEGGHRVAMFDLANLIRRKDPERALEWTIKAAELDLLPAQMTLAKMYETGKGAPKDHIQAFIWTIKVASKPSAPAFWLSKAGDLLLKGGKGVPQSTEQALVFYEGAADKGDIHALSLLGRMYMEGFDVPQDKEKAIGYLKKAAAGGDKEAKKLLKGNPDVPKK